MKKDIQKLTLDLPVTYQIKVPGVLDEKWLDWIGGVMIPVESDKNGDPMENVLLRIYPLISSMKLLNNFSSQSHKSDEE